MRFIAYLLPRGVLYWAVIRVWAEITTTTHQNSTPDQVTVWDALKHLQPEAQ